MLGFPLPLYAGRGLAVYKHVSRRDVTRLSATFGWLLAVSVLGAQTLKLRAGV